MSLVFKNDLEHMDSATGLKLAQSKSATLNHFIEQPIISS